MCQRSAPAGHARFLHARRHQLCGHVRGAGPRAGIASSGELLEDDGIEPSRDRGALPDVAPTHGGVIRGHPPEQRGSSWGGHPSHAHCARTAHTEPMSSTTSTARPRGSARMSSPAMAANTGASSSIRTGVKNASTARRKRRCTSPSRPLGICKRRETRFEKAGVERAAPDGLVTLHDPGIADRGYRHRRRLARWRHGDRSASTGRIAVRPCFPTRHGFVVLRP